MASFADYLVPLLGSSAEGENDRFCRLLMGMLSPFQRRFVQSKSRFKVARCGRRSGKTWAVAIYMIHECLQKRVPVLYAGLTRDSAKEAVWDILISLLEELKIPHDPRLSSLQISFKNGSKITLFGCDAQNARNRLRSRKYKLIVFDETGFFTALDPLVYAVLPMLADYGGTLVFASSPGTLLQGIFYEADQGKRKEHWDRFTWTIHDNPHFQKPALDPRYKTRADEELALMLTTQYDGDAEHPDYRREWLGQWVRDASSLIYPLTGTNLVKPYTMPHEDHAFGINLSHPFINTLLVGRYSAYSRNFQIIDQLDVEDSSLDQFVDVIEEQREIYDPAITVAYLGDYTQDILVEFRKRYKIPVTPIDKRDKSFHQRIFANDLQSGYIQINPCLSLVSDCAKIVKDTSGDEIVGQETFAADTALSLYRRVYQTTLQAFEPELTEEQRHIQQLENSRFDEPIPWPERA